MVILFAMSNLIDSLVHYLSFSYITGEQKEIVACNHSAKGVNI